MNQSKFEYLLRPPEIAFAMELAAGKDVFESYQKAYNPSIHNQPLPAQRNAARTLANTPKIQERVAYYQRRFEMKLLLT